MNIENIEDEFFYKSLESKKTIIEKQLELQNQKKNMLFEYCNTIMNVISIAKNVENNWDDILTKLKETMEMLSINIQTLQSMKSKIVEIIQLVKQIRENDKTLEEKKNNINTLQIKLEEYDKEETEKFPKILDQTKENEELINQIIKNTNTILAKENEIEEKKKSQEQTITIKDEKNEKQEIQITPKIEQEQKNGQENLNNKTLIISEMEKKVYLPYYENDIKELMVKNPNKTIQEIIEENYIVDIKKFKNPITSRFKESYNLIRKKDHGSIAEAIELGMELMLNYSLNPAVIAACRNQDELDIYLDCLEEKELDQFDIFDIKYVSAPMIVKEKKNKHAKY